MIQIEKCSREEIPNEEISFSNCPREYVLAINDAMNAFTGKWKLAIIGALISGKQRFSALEKTIPKINPRMLSKELRDLEANGILKRRVNDSLPVAVECELTPSGYAMRPMFEAMIDWGIKHRAWCMPEKISG